MSHLQEAYRAASGGQRGVFHGQVRCLERCSSLLCTSPRWGGEHPTLSDGTPKTSPASVDVECGRLDASEHESLLLVVSTDVATSADGLIARLCELSC